MLVTELFIRDALNYRDWEPMFAVDGAPWLAKALEGLATIQALSVNFSCP
jgi:transposase-like protein